MTFKELYLSGQIPFEEIDRYISRWNRSDDERTLAKYLGLNADEEDVWIDDSDEALKEMLDARERVAGTPVTLGKTDIIVNKNGFGALPIQRISFDDAKVLLRKAYDAGVRFFDTARFYTDSEEKIGYALSDVREHIYIATKTAATTAEGFWKDLETSLHNLKTDYVDIYQFHNPAVCPKPGDGSGLYEAMLEAKEQGKIRFIGITNHRMSIAEEAIESGLYDTLQFPFNYLSTEREIALAKACAEHEMGFIAMKGLSGGLLTNSAAIYAYMAQFENILPIWGVQKESELDEFLSYIGNPPELTDELKAVIEKDQKELAGEFCRGCGYCMPCPAGIEINNCARMSLLLRRSPSAIPLPGGTGEDEEDKGLPALRTLQVDVPVWSGHAGSFERNYTFIKRFLQGRNCKEAETMDINQEQKERLEQQFAFIREIDKEKFIGRQTYLTDGERKENDAEHAWHMAIMTVLLAEYSNEPIDVLKTVTMLLIHDLVEIDAGDTYAYDEEAKKTQRERELKGAERIFGMLPPDQGEKLRALWDEFEAGETPEARFAHTMDNIQPTMLNDASKGKAWATRGVHLSQILGRNKNTAKGSETLWNYSYENFITPSLREGKIKNDTLPEE